MTKTVTNQRPYERTHPWLTFAFDLGRLQHTDWLALGEAAAMIDRIAGAPLDPDVAEEVHRLYLARGALATTAIEGNTLSEAEARAVIDDRATLPPSRAYLGREIRNIVEACNMVAGEIAGQGRFPLDVAGVERLNAMVLQGLEVDDHVEPGKVRKVNVSVGGYRCPDRRDTGFLLARLCEVLNGFPLPDENRCAFSILKAVFAHLYFVWIHPFGDGNGRTARLIELAILLEAGLPQPACHLPSNHYNLTRTEYYRQLARASGQEDGIYGFASYAIRGFADGLREQVEVIREHQEAVAWTNFVHGQFGEGGGATERRRRSLVLALSRQPEAVPVNRLPSLDATVARDYATVSNRTLLRDVEVLVRRNLLASGPDGVRANRERIRAFLPWRNEPPS